MFKSLRPNNSVYILHKDTATMDIGTLVSVTNPIPKYQFQPMYTAPQEMVVDIVVNVNNQDVSYKQLPAHSDLADFGDNNIVITDNREAMNSEVMSLKQKSLSILDSVEYHKNLINCCDKMLADLNPEFAEKQNQQNEINQLKSNVSELSDKITKLLALNEQLTLQLKKE